MLLMLLELPAVAGVVRSLKNAKSAPSSATTSKSKENHACVSIPTTVCFVGVVTTVVLSITDEGGKCTKASTTLKTAGLTFEFRC